jgi:hypothetical protein
MMLPFVVGNGGTVPANTTGNALGLTISNTSTFAMPITAGMYDCTALRDSKRQVTIGLICVYGFATILAGIVITTVKGKDRVE